MLYIINSSFLEHFFCLQQGEPKMTKFLARLGVTVALLLSISATSSEAATVDFSTVNSANVPFTNIPDGDWEATFTGLTSRIDPGVRVEFSGVATINPIGTPPFIVDLYQDVELIFNNLDEPYSVVGGPLSRSPDGTLTAPLSGAFNYSGPAVPLSTQLRLLAANGGTVGIAASGTQSVLFNFANLTPLDTGGGGVPDVAPIPLPAAGWFLLASLGGLSLLRRRQQRLA